MEELLKEAGDRLPKHVGIILDGNRRWALKRKLGIDEGHKAGYENLREMLFSFLKAGIHYVSVYALSLENVRGRSTAEIEYLFGLIEKALGSINDFAKIKEEEVRITISGDLSRLPKAIQDSVRKKVDSTKKFNKNFLNICVMYDGQEEIVHAVKNIIKDKIKPKNISREMFRNYLYANDFPPLDYVIRTGMEDGARISGFMLWDASYAEFRFRDEYWPDYNEEMLIEDLKEYLRRKRRMGK